MFAVRRDMRSSRKDAEVLSRFVLLSLRRKREPRVLYRCILPEAEGDRVSGKGSSMDGLVRSGHEAPLICHTYLLFPKYAATIIYRAAWASCTCGKRVLVGKDGSPEPQGRRIENNTIRGPHPPPCWTELILAGLFAWV